MSEYSHSRILVTIPVDNTSTASRLVASLVRSLLPLILYPARPLFRKSRYSDPDNFLQRAVKFKNKDSGTQQAQHWVNNKEFCAKNRKMHGHRSLQSQSLTR